ncbi:hypothetical protein ACFY00_34745 [Kitasatospora sp. NPDC001540]|uniref:hypothetical protein n=1 Tax=Kitasatospora sp. NPDC001540 TaxID=3364014 RepID=UPI0036C718AA
MPPCPRDLLASTRGGRRRTAHRRTAHTHRPTTPPTEQVTAAGAEVRTRAEIVERPVGQEVRIDVAAPVPEPVG